jgi:hypothetical protein
MPRTEQYPSRLHPLNSPGVYQSALMGVVRLHPLDAGDYTSNVAT